MKKITVLILPIITLVLEILPYGAVCNFANPDGEPWRRTFSYFDLTPFGYANFAPLITAIITCIILVMLIVYCITDKITFAIKTRNILFVCATLSLAPLVLGISYYSIVALFITLTLITIFPLISLKLI